MKSVPSFWIKFVRFTTYTNCVSSVKFNKKSAETETFEQSGSLVEIYSAYACVW